MPATCNHQKKHSSGEPDQLKIKITETTKDAKKERMQTVLKNLSAGLGSVVFLFFALNCTAAELEKRPYHYTQNFEGKTHPVKFWCCKGKYKINFAGLTEEKSFSGKKSFKLDVTFEDGGYFYWNIRLPKVVPAEGKLKFSGRIYVGKETTGGKAGLGVNVYYPPTSYSGCSRFASGKKGKWKLIEGDIVKYGQEGRRNVMAKYVWNATERNVGVYLDRVGLFLTGAKGKRVVVYIDDIKVEGEVPTEQAYKEEINKRWAEAGQKFNEKINLWNTLLRQRREELKTLANLSPEAEQIKKAVEEKVTFLEKKVEKIKKKGLIPLSEQKEIDSFLEQLKKITKNIESVSAGKLKSKDMLIYVVPPISGLKILPHDSFVPGNISDKIKMVATAGEYEPVSFVVSALSDIRSLKVEATDLKGKKMTIPAGNIDIKIVKCWYQAGSAWFGIGQDKDKKVLIPELLLNDDTLVKVDYKEEKNYLKLNFPDGDKYIWISNPEEKGGNFKFLSIKDYPVKDSPVLLPVNIPAKTNKQFWITVKVPDTAKAGTYAGNITLSVGKETYATIDLKLKVLPFKLASPKTYYDIKEDFVSSIYYRGKIHPKYPQGSISCGYKSEEQLRAELKNMFAHGITNPMVYQSFNKKLLGKYLKIRQEVGMGNQPLYSIGVSANSKPEAIKKLIEFAKPYGITEVYFHGLDEARGERLKAQRITWQATRKAGGKVFVAGYRGRSFEAMGDIQNLLVCAHFPLREEAEKWHSVGHKIWCYANPQAGPENPELFRRNFGLFLWKANYDGAATYAYQHSFGNIWNDFDHYKYRSNIFVYPTVNGVIDTIAFEGYREAIDDIRYATTLKLKIEEARKSRSEKVKKIALSAEQYLQALNPNARNLDVVRLEIINYILKLTTPELSTRTQEKVVYPCYRLVEEPVLDGNVKDDPAWKSVPEATGFVQLGNNSIALRHTCFRMGYTPEAVYFGIECDDPDVGKIKAQAGDGDVRICTEDSVEIFLFPKGAKSYHQFMINTIGSRWNGIGMGGPKMPLGNWQAKVHKGNVFFSIEIKIPFAILGQIPKDKEIWQGNIGRNIRSHRLCRDTWAPLISSFHESENFREIVFKDRNLSPAEVKKEEKKLNYTAENIFKKDIIKRMKLFSAWGKDFPEIHRKYPSMQREVAAIQASCDKMKKLVASLNTLPPRELCNLHKKNTKLLVRIDELRAKVLLADFFK